MVHKHSFQRVHAFVECSKSNSGSRWDPCQQQPVMVLWCIQQSNNDAHNRGRFHQWSMAVIILVVQWPGCKRPTFEVSLQDQPRHVSPATRRDSSMRVCWPCTNVRDEINRADLFRARRGTTLHWFEY
jgi:hypothetical protein